MAAKNSDRTAKRKGQPRGRPFPPGQSGNPGGRPKGLGAIREQLADLEPIALQKLKQSLEDPDKYLEAVKLILAYRWGKPPQSLELTGKDGESLTIQVNKLVFAETNPLVTKEGE